MSKPFELDELLSRVKNLLQVSQRSGNNGGSPTKTPPSEPIDVITFGCVDVDFQTHQVRVDGKPVRMTPKELRLLRYFVQNPERVISRSELLVQVWEMSGNVQTRAVDQFIARLRKLIEPNPTEPVHLLTLRDAGYRFVLEPENAEPENAESDK